MALTERSYTTWDKQNELGHIGVKLVTVIERDGVKISETLHRHVISPGDDYSNEDAEVQKICAAVHTPEVVAAYQALMAENALP